MTNDSLTEALIQAADGELVWTQQLLAAGANPNGMPLMMAIQCGELVIVEMMLKAGADVNVHYSGTTPLIHAIVSGYPEVVHLFIRAGAAVNQSAPDGTRPLTAARTQGRANATVEEREQIIHHLIDAGAHE